MSAQKNNKDKITAQKNNKDKESNNDDNKKTTETPKTFKIEIIEQTDTSCSDEQECYDESSSGSDILNVSCKQDVFLWEDSSTSLENGYEFNFEEETVKKFKRDQEEKINLKECVFTAKCKIKLFKVYDDIFVIVDTFNIIYVVDKITKGHKTYKISYFKISDFIKINDNLFFGSEVSTFLYCLNIKTGKITSVNKQLGYVRKFKKISSTRFLILGEKLVVGDENLQKINSFTGTFAAVATEKTGGRCIALKKTGEICEFDSDLNLLGEKSFDSKFSFKNIFITTTHLFVGTEMGMLIFDHKYNKVKEITQLPCSPTGFSSTSKYVCLFGTEQPFFRIYKNNYTFESFEGFPYATIKNATGIESFEDKIFIAKGSQVLEYNLTTNLPK